MLIKVLMVSPASLHLKHTHTHIHTHPTGLERVCLSEALGHKPIKLKSRGEAL